MLLTTGELKPTAKLSADMTTVRLAKTCLLTHQEYWVDIPFDMFKRIKKGSKSELSHYTINQRRFIIAWLTPKEYEALKKDGI